MLADTAQTFVTVGLVLLAVSVPLGFLGLTVMRFERSRVERRCEEVRRSANEARQRGDDDAAILRLILGSHLPPIPTVKLYAEASGRPVEQAKAQVVPLLPERQQRSLARLGPRVDQLLTR